MYTFDLTTLSPSEIPLVADYSTLAGEELKALLSDEPGIGSYSLVGGASGFATGIQICLDSGVCIGLLHLYDGFCYNGFCYTLDMDGTTLRLLVSGDETVYVSETVVGAGEELRLSSGSALLNAVVSPTGHLEVLGGGAVSSATVSSGGTLTVFSGGVTDATTVQSGAVVSLTSGAHLNGGIDAGGTVAVQEGVDAVGATFTFNITSRSSTDEYILNDLATLDGATFSVIVSGTQATGNYRLAGNASGFDGTVSIYSDNGSHLVDLTVGNGACFGAFCYTVDVDNDGILTLDVAVSDVKRSEVVLPYTMPQAEYMYGCVPTALGMLLGYYDKYGYLGYDVSDLLAGDISIYSRSLDGNPYDMDAFDTVLGNFIATQNYVDMFYNKTPDEELEYAFDDEGNVNVAVFDCLAGWLGTGQFWRGNDDLSTTHYAGDLEWLLSTSQTLTVTNGKESHTIPVQYTDFKGGLSAYLATVGYSLDAAATGTWSVDVKGGDFTFEDYMAEIDAGRAVLISINSQNSGHKMVGYGYDSISREIIFDDTYLADQRMEWGGTYTYAGEDFTLSSIDTIVFDTTGLSPKSNGFYQIGSWGNSLADAQEYARTHNVPILLYYGSVTCGPCLLLGAQVFDSDDFHAYSDTGSLVLLKNVYVPGLTSYGTPTCVLIDADGNVLDKRVGYLSGKKNEWMEWFKEYVSLLDRSVYTLDLEVSSMTLSSSRNGTPTLEFTDYDPLYLNALVTNVGTTATGEALAGIFVDGLLFQTVTVSGLEENGSFTINGVSLGRLSLGYHTIEVRLDYTNAFEERNEANNAIAHTVKVTPATTGRIIISSGTSVISSAILANAFVLESGNLQIRTSGIVERTVVLLGGVVNVSSGGTATSMNVSEGGKLTISNSGLANELSVSSGGTLYVSNGAVVDTLSLYNGGSAFMNGGILQNAAILGTMTMSGGNAGELVVGGSLILSPSATVSGLEIVEGGSVFFNSGAKLVETVQNGGELYVNSGAVVSGITQNDGYFVLYSGAVASKINQNSGTVFLQKGALASGTTQYGGYFRISSGAQANDITLNKGYCYVYNSANASGITIQSNGFFYIYDGHASGVTQYGGTAHIYSSNGLLSGLTQLGGILTVHPGGTLQDAVISSGGSLAVIYGATLHGTLTLENGAWLKVSSGADVQGAVVHLTTASLYTLTDLAALNGITLKVTATEGLGGRFCLANGASSFTGTVTVLAENGTSIGTLGVGNSLTKNGITYSVQLDSGSLYFRVTGKALAPIITVTASNEHPTSSPITLIATVTDDTDGTQLSYSLDGETFTDYTSGVTLTANSTVTFKAIDTDGNVTTKEYTVSNIFTSGQLAADHEAPIFTTEPTTSIKENHVTWCWEVTDNLAVEQVVLTVGGRDFELSPDNVTYSLYAYGQTDWSLTAVDVAGNRTAVSGHLELPIPLSAVMVYELSGTSRILVSSGTSMMGKTISSGGTMIVRFGGVAENTVLADGDMWVYSNGIASGTTQNSGYLYIYDSGQARGIVLNSGGTTIVRLGGVAENTVLADGDMRVYSNGIASGITQNSGYLYIFDSGQASGITLDDGRIQIFNDAMLNGLTQHSGLVYIYSNGRASGVTQTNGEMRVSASALLHGLTQSGGRIYVSNGVQVSKVIQSDGVIDIRNNCHMADLTQFGGTVYVNYGGTLQDAVIYSGGSLVVSGEAKLRGTLTIENGAWLKVSSGADAQGAVVHLTTASLYTLDNLALLNGVTLSVTASDGVGGRFCLAKGAASYTGTVTVLAENGASIGTLGVGNSLTKNGITYSVQLDSSSLYFHVSGKTLAPTITITANKELPTGRPVTLTATVMDDTDGTLLSYSLDGKTFIAYTSGVAMTANGTVTFKAIDTDGNVSTKDYTVTNICTPEQLEADHEAPVFTTEPSVSSSGNWCTWSWEASDNLAIEQLVLRVENQSYELTADTNSYSLYAYGKTDWSLTAVDVAGNQTVANGHLELPIPSSAVMLYALSGSSRVLLSSGTSMKGKTVSSGGTMLVRYAGKADNTTLAGGSLCVSSNALASGVTQNSGQTYISYYGQANGIVQKGGGLYVSYDGVVNNITQSGGSMSVRMNGVVNGLTQSGGITYIYNNGLVDGIAQTDGDMYIYSGGLANSVTQQNGIIHIFSNGLASGMTQTGGSLSLYKNGLGSGIVQCGGGISITENAQVSEVVQSGGSITISNSGTLNGIVQSGGAINANKGGRIMGFTQYGGVCSVTSSILQDATISAGGQLVLARDAVLSGTLALESGASLTMTDSVNAYEAEVKLTLASLYVVDNLSYLEGASLRVIAAVDQANGSYTLASNIASFTGTVTVCVESGICMEAMRVGETQHLGGTAYSVSIKNNDLVLTLRSTSALPEITIIPSTTSPTNQSVTIIATVTDDTANTQLLYSLDGSSYSAYSSPIVQAENGTVYFKAIDIDGNAALAQYTISNIDRVAPTISDIEADVSSPTNGTVVVTAEARDDVNEVTLFYSQDGGAFVEYADGVSFTSNGTVVFKAIDAAGNETVSDAFTVGNIDKAEPEIFNIRADITAPTHGAVVVTAEASDDAGDVTLFYSQNGGAFAAYTNGVTFTVNGTVRFKAIDAVGNETVSDDFTVRNIDTVAPVISNIHANVTAPTKGSVVVTAKANDDVNTVSLFYSQNGGNFVPYTNGVTFAANGSVVFKAIDAAGNETISNVFTVNNIDTIAPIISNIRADITELTNGNVVVTAEANDDAGAITLFYSRDGGNFVEYVDGAHFTANGTVVFKAIDAAGNETVSDVFTVNNIDTTAPVINLAAYTTKPRKKSPLIATTEAGLDIFYSTDNETWTKYTGALEVTENGTWFFKATDAAGNTGTNSITFNNIDNAVPVIELTGDFTSPLQATTLTATTEDGLDIFFSTDNETWTKYTGTLDITSNGTWFFKTTDAVGNTGTNSIIINNIDTTAPAISNIQANITTPTNGNVVVTAEASDSNAVTLFYSQDGGDFVEYVDGAHFTENGTVVFKAIDAAGNETVSDVFTVNNIDTVAPVINLAAYTNKPRKKSPLIATTEAGLDIFYSTDNETWMKYTEALEVTENGTWFFKATDAAGNTGTNSITFNNIDNAAPVIQLIGDNTTPLKATTLTATTEDGLDIFFSTDSETWTKYTGALEVTENDTWFFKATDAAGNTGTNSITFANIDNTAPVIQLTGDNTTPLKATTLTATTEDGLDIFYSTDNETWTKYTRTLDISENCTWFFKATDAAGNTGTNSITFNNIDNSVPVIELTGDFTSPLQATTLTATTEAGLDIFFSTDNETWTKYTGTLDITSNGSWFFKATDAVGNTGTNSIIINNIDTTAPVISNIQANVTTPTNGNVVVTAEASDANIVTLFYSQDGGNFVEYVDGAHFTENGTVVFKAIDAAGNETVSDVFTVNNIDTTAPVIKLAAYTNKPRKKSPLIATTEAGPDIFYSTDNETWTEYTEPLEVTENGTWFFKATDAAGNTGTNSITFNNIDNAAPVIQLIGDNTTPLKATTLTATTEDGLDIFFSTDNERWMLYTAPLDITSNGTWFFKATDAAENTGYSQMVFANIDNTVPVIQLTGDNTTPLKATTLTATTEDGLDIFFSTDNETWTKYTRTLDITENGTWFFKATDAAGNTGTNSITFNNIDNAAPVIQLIGDNTTPLKATTLTATTEDGLDIFFSTDNERWMLYTAPLDITSNGTWFFKATDAAGNTGYSQMVFANIDNTVPVIQLTGDNTTPLQTATLAANTETGLDIFYSTDNETWTKFTKTLDITENGTWFFKATDAAGNIGFAQMEFANIDTVAPTLLSIDIGAPGADGTVTITLTTSETLSQLLYSWQEGQWQELDGEALTVAENGTAKFKLIDLAGNETITQAYMVDSIVSTVTEVELQNTNNGAVIDWHGDTTAAWTQQYDVALTVAGGTIELPKLAASGIELQNVPTGEISITMKPHQSDVWSEEIALVTQNEADDAPTAFIADTNGLVDVMFATAHNVWNAPYQARFVGSGAWASKVELVPLAGMNRIDDIFVGSDDASILLLTDDANGDALFVDDIYSAFPTGMDVQARIAKIDEIRAGAGNDLIDLTSQHFDFSNGVTIKGGDGDDILWAHSGSNRLFGDDGNDSIIGANGNDLLVGGAGNDSLHGGGGNDIFVFGGNWGNDTVEQLAGGKVTLWFDEESKGTWNDKTLTYTDGDKSVVVSEGSSVTLKFGNDGSEQYAALVAAGAFSEFTTRNIFENKGMLRG